MRITEIDINNFKSIKHLHINFEDIKGFWELQGNVGSGKTSVGEAILFALFGTLPDKNNGDLVRWGDTKCTMTLRCVCKNRIIDIERTISKKGTSTLMARCNGKDIVFTNKRDAQSILENEYYDVPRVILEQLCIISFNNFKSISTMSAVNKKKLLDNVFGFSLLTQYADTCKVLAGECREEYRFKSNEKSIIEGQIRRIRERLERGTDTETYTDADIETLDARISQLEHDRILLEREADAETQKYNGDIVKLTERLGHIKSEGVRIKNDIEFLRKGICPTCGAALDQSHLEEYEQRRSGLLEQYKTLQSEIDGLRSQMSEYKNNAAKKSTDIIQQIQDMKCERISMLDSIENAKINTQEIDKYTSDLSGVSARIDEVKHDELSYSDLQTFINVTLRNNIMGSIVPHINKYIEDFLRELHQPYIVRFDGDFNCSIYIVGKSEPIHTRSLSTGQLKMVDMVTILAILKVVMNSVNFNIWFLDELMSNMDDELRDVMCSILKANMDANHTLFVISHARLNEFCTDGRIEVTNQYNNSVYNIVKK